MDRIGYVDDEFGKESRELLFLLHTCNILFLS